MHGRAFGAGLFLISFAVSGCASILEGRSQEIVVSTDPPGAECAFYREGGARIATIERTPGSATIRKTKNDIWIVCVMPGYQEAIYYNRSGGTLTNVVAGILTLGISTAVDSSTGSDNQYLSPANVVMVPNPSGMTGAAALPATFTAAQPPGAYSQQVASRFAPGPAPPRRRPNVPVASAPAPPAAAEPPAPPERPASPAGSPAYDGSYSGSVEVLEANVQPSRRQVDVRVVNGAGSGTVKHALCDEPGAVSFTVDSAGTIRGRANTRNTIGCTERITTLDGRMEGGQMRLVLRLPGNPQLVMAKTQGGTAAAPVAAAAAPAHGRFDGSYSGPLELAAGDLRQLWLRVVGTKGTGSVRRPACGQPGFISISIADDGSVSGDADVLSSLCTPLKATVKGQVNGTRLGVTLVLPDGHTSPEAVFTRRSYD